MTASGVSRAKGHRGLTAQKTDKAALAAPMTTHQASGVRLSATDFLLQVVRRTLQTNTTGDSRKNPKLRNPHGFPSSSQTLLEHSGVGKPPHNLFMTSYCLHTMEELVLFGDKFVFSHTRVCLPLDLMPHPSKPTKSAIPSAALPSSVLPEIAKKGEEARFTQDRRTSLLGPLRPPSAPQFL